MLGNFVQKHAEAAALFAEVSVLHVCFDESIRQNNPQIVFGESSKIKTLHLYCRKSSNPLIRLCRYLKAYQKGLKLFTESIYRPDVIHANVTFPVGLLFLLFKKF